MGARVLKWAALGGLTLLLLVAAVAGIAGFLIGTPEGLNLVLEKGRGFIPGELTVGKIEGGLLGHLVLKKVSYRQGALEISADEFSLVWAPAELFHGRLHVKDMRAAGVCFVQGEERARPREKEATGPLNLPDIALPLSVALDNVEIKGIRAGGRKGQEGPLEINRVVLRAFFDDSGLALSNFEFFMPELTFHSSGRLIPHGEYPLDITMDWSADLPDPEIKVRGRGTLAGDMKKLKLLQILQGDIASEISAEILSLLDDLKWKAKFQVSHVSNRLFERFGVLSGDEALRAEAALSARGDLKQAALSAAIRLAPGREKVHARDGNFTLAGKGLLKAEKEHPAQEETFRKINPGVMELDANATVDLSSMKFRATGRWQDIRWPLSGIPSYVSDNGLFAVEGTPDDYMFSLSAGVNGTDIPYVRLEMKGTGTSDRAQIQRADARLLGGQVSLKGTAGWKPFLWWKAHAQAQDLNPGLKYPDWPGNLAFELESQGKFQGGIPDIQVELVRLGGMLRKRRVNGRASASFLADELNIKGLKFWCGRSELEIQGLAGSKWDLSWKASVPDMADLFPDGRGSLHGSGRLFGNGPLPSARGRLGIRNFSLLDLGCRKLSSDFTLSADNSGPLFLELKGHGISASGQDISDLSVQLRGTLSKHKLAAHAAGSLGKISLEADEASFDIKTRKWKGVLAGLELDLEEFGRWQLQEPVEMAVSPEDVQVSRLCLKDLEASLCLEGHWLKKQGGLASFSLKNLSLERFRPFLNADITELQGRLDADLHADLGRVPTGRLDLSLSPGFITYRVDASRQVRVSYRGGKVEARLDEKMLSADLDLGMGKNGLNASIVLSRKSLENDIRKTPLRGRVKLDARELGLMTAFFPSVTEKEGIFTADFTLGGLISDPDVKGSARLKISGLDVPLAGIHIDETLLEIFAEKARNIRVKGSLKSGEDLINIAGSINTDARKGWPARLEIKGNNFKIIDIPDALVRISPDLRLSYSENAGVVAQGLLVIPEAEITPQEMPEGVEKPSEDVVIVSTENPHGRKTSVPLRANIEIELKDKVHFRGFGLDCHVVGRLTVSVIPGKRPVGHGELRIKDGTFHIYGHDLEIKKGIISYAGGPLDNPGINLLAVRDVGGQPVGVRVIGSASAIKVSGYSADPSISSEDALTMLITGKTKNDPGFEKAARNTAAIAGADLAAKEFLAFTGLDHLDVKGSGENSSETRIFAGQDVTERLTLGVEAGTGDEGTQIVARYHLWKGLEFEMKSGDDKSEMSLLYTIEIK